MREGEWSDLGVRMAHTTLQNITKHLSAFLPTCPLDFLIKWELNFIKLGSHHSKIAHGRPPFAIYVIINFFIFLFFL